MQKQWQVPGMLLLGFFLIQATCPDLTGGGYLGNLGDTSGNCAPLPLNLPPLSAFGSLQVNQNAPMGTTNRLNPTQIPTTNNFQNFQNPCAISSTSWTYNPCATESIPTGAGPFRVRTGAYLVGMARTGPVATISQFNANVNTAFPNITANSRITVFFSAVETNQGAANDYFSISTNVVNSETCLINYTPNNGAPGSLIDYNVTGNAFHDVYYNNLTPVLAISNPFSTNPDGTFLVGVGNPASIGANLTKVAPGASVTGSYFQFFVQRYSSLGPATFVIYAEDAAENTVKIHFVDEPPYNQFFVTFDRPFTGFLRLAALSTNDPLPTTFGTTWSQGSFFMPEDACDPNDTSRPVVSTCTPPITAPPFISPCPVEDPTCPLTVQSDAWWKTAEVDCLAATGLSFYLLFTHPWTGLLAELSQKTIGANWPGSNLFVPSGVGLSDFLHVLATSGYTGTAPNPIYANSYDFAHHYYDSFATSVPATADPSDPGTNLFLVEFDMAMGFQMMSDITTFQATRPLPSYTIAGPVNSSFNISAYTAHRRFIPVQADILTNATTLTWTYTPSPLIPATTPGMAAFPLWKYLPVGTSPIDYIFNDTIKGTLYGATCNPSGSVTFVEKGMPAWYSATNPFIPPTLTFTSTQITNMQTAYDRITQLLIPPLPIIPENDLNDGYSAGKRCLMLAKTAIWGAYFFSHGGTPHTSIIADLQPFIDNAKSILNSYLLGRTGGTNYFVADQTTGGICVNGAGGIGTYAQGPNLQHPVDAGEDFGNYIYNDHHFFAGYYLLSAAMIAYWEKTINPGAGGPFWVDQQVIGADNQTYRMRQFIDFLWRDTHNPFHNDPDFPYDRYGFPWEGHGIANGLQYTANTLGRNQESIEEDFNCWVGMNTFSNLMLSGGSQTLSANDTTIYTTVRDFSLMNMQLLASSASVQWFKNSTVWKGVNMYLDNPTFLGPAIYIGQFTQATVQNGEINDLSVQNQTFF